MSAGVNVGVTTIWGTNSVVYSSLVALLWTEATRRFILHRKSCLSRDVLSTAQARRDFEQLLFDVPEDVLEHDILTDYGRRWIAHAVPSLRSASCHGM